MSAPDAFHDLRFPTTISFGATGGPERRTEIVSLVSGQEKRNARTALSRRRYDAATGLRLLADLETLVAFFEARRGPLTAFRFRDPFDWKSCAVGETPAQDDQALGTGDGLTRRFALVKRYGTGGDAYLRPIRKPVAGTLRVAVAGVEAAPGDFAFDDATGEVVFVPGKAPGDGAAVTAGYEFDVAVRFDTDRIEVGIRAFKAGTIPSIPLVEVLP